jgi:hypothetical protein
MSTTVDEVLPYKIHDLDEARTFVGRWVRTNWRSHTPPKHHMVFQIKDVLTMPGERNFLDLWSPIREDLQPVDLDYPLIHITAEEAQMRIDAWRQAVLSGKATRKSLERVAPGEKLVIPPPQDVANQARTLDRLPKPTQAPYTRSAVSASSIIRDMYREGADNQSIIAKVTAAFPDRDPKRLLQQIYQIRSNARRDHKAAKADMTETE